MEMFPGPLVFDTVGSELRGDAPLSVAESIREIKYFPGDYGLGGLYLNVIEFPVFLADTAMLHQPIAKGGASAPEAPLLYDLRQSGLGSNGGLEALP